MKRKGPQLTVNEKELQEKVRSEISIRAGNLDLNNRGTLDLAGLEKA